jgi:hypothetical protein
MPSTHWIDTPSNIFQENEFPEISQRRWHREKEGSLLGRGEEGEIEALG